MNTSYELIVTGGGTSGAAAAITAAKNGIKTLLIEKNSFLGGAMTSQLVMPMMNNISFRHKIFEKTLLHEIFSELAASNDAVVFKDGNPGWFNPEKMKHIFEKKAIDSGVDIIYDAAVIDVEKKEDILKSIKVFFKGENLIFSSKYFIDATGDANIAAMSGVEFESGLDGKNQFMSLRFEMSGVDTKSLAGWMRENSIDDDVSCVYEKSEDEIYLSLGFCYNQNKTPYEAVNEIIDKALKHGDITPDDVEYVQFFSVPGKDGTLSFNCPRINRSLDPLSVFDTTKALIEGRKKILTLEKFLKKYICGFENAYISQEASSLGIRDSRRIKSNYILSKEDIRNSKEFTPHIFESDYPVDVHQKGKEISTVRQKFCAPVECCTCKKVKNLFVIGRCIGADFYAQAALRIQPNCFAMGEFIGEYIKNMLRNDTL